MKVIVDIDIDTLINTMISQEGVSKSKILATMLRNDNFSTDDIMDSIEILDRESGEWEIFERAVKFVERIKKELHADIIDAHEIGYISKEVFKLLELK